MAKINPKVVVSISQYKFKVLNFGFLGVMIMAMVVSMLIYIKRWWIQLLLIMIAWMICECLIEKEVNNWLKKEAIVEIKNG